MRLFTSQRLSASDGGFALLQLIVGAAVGTLVVLLMVSSFSTLVTRVNSDANRVNTDVLDGNLVLTLRRALGGQFGLPNLRFRVPGTDLVSTGTGFIVNASRDLEGKEVLGELVSDSLYFVLRVSNSQMTVVGDPPQSGPFTLRYIRPPAVGTNSRGIYKSTFFAISIAEVSEVFTAETPVPAQPDGGNQVTVSPRLTGDPKELPTFDSTLAGSLLDPAEGDLAYEVGIVSVGLERGGGKHVQRTDFGRSEFNSSSVLSHLRSLRLAYRLGPPIATCTDVPGTGYGVVEPAPADGFRTDWHRVNAVNACYQRLTAIRLTTVNDAGTTHSTEFPLR